MAVMLTSGAGRGRRRFGGRGPMSEINVTPLVDVMLVLLIIFMVTAPLLTAGIPIDLPDSKAKPLSQDSVQVTLSLTRDGRAYLDDAEVAPGALPEQLAGLPRAVDGKPPLIILRADRLLDYGRIIEVMGELNRAGFNSISLITLAAAEARERDQRNPAR